MNLFSVPEMTCSHCEKTVEQAIMALDAAATIKVDLDKHVVEVEAMVGPESIIDALREAGYEASVL